MMAADALEALTLPARWWVKPLLWTIAIAAAVAFVSYGIHLYNDSLREDGREEIRAAWARQVQVDQAAQNRKELAWKRQLEELQHASDEDRARLAADAARARAAADGLRKQLADYAAAWRDAGRSASAAGNGQAAGDPIGVLAELLGRIDERAGVLAQVADDARAAGQQCERSYDALTKAAP